jgi:DNA-binding transcriptional ArsR family regulator
MASPDGYHLQRNFCEHSFAEDVLQMFLCDTEAEMADTPEEPDTHDAVRREPMLVDAGALKALAHPLRVQMYDLLADHGPATASQLGEQVGESSGTTSYHLRLLAKHGFIEEDPDRGNRRDRWWRVRPGGYTLEATRMLDDPTTRADLRVAAGELWRTYARQVEQWFRSAELWGDPWTSSSVSNLMRLEATPEDMREIREDVLAVLQRHADRLRDREPPSGSVRVAVQFHLFPLERPQDNPPKP